MTTTDVTLNRDLTRTKSPVPVRGVVVAAIVVALGLVLIDPIGRGVGVGDLLILAVMSVTAILGAKEAQRLVQAREAEVATEPGEWMTVIVGPQGPLETAGQITLPKAPPRNDPERRSLVRRAMEREPAGGRVRR
ncbi:MAG: hypothetical protein JWN86_3958 [Planctomycetota bacterium]|nr:hypothetical protein [Planctomycetota bacterium]